MSFSDRIGITKKPDVLLMEVITPALRNSIWNIIVKTIYNQYRGGSHYQITQDLAEYFFKIPIDSVPLYGGDSVNWFRERFFDARNPWWFTYNVVEFLSSLCDPNAACWWSTKTYFQSEINFVLERELSGYRFIDGTLAPISNQQEVSAVQEAISNSSTNGFMGVHTHITSAIALLSQKPQPDYRNSIKESISAIESISKLLSGESNGGLDKALSILDAKVHFHGAFKAALLNLYGFTSDKSGIRHAILEEPNVGFDEAKYMLISCSAFVNFIIAKADKANKL